MAVRLLRLRGFPILQQLRLEEALLRADAGNWFLINDGTPQPSVVLGISGKPHDLVHLEAAHRARIQLIKRFTGGGTVVVDSDTIFTALIMHADALAEVPCYPRPVMRWTEQLYSSAFARHGSFHLRENDYVFGERKFGGNAQAITKNRWLHHTSFLWDFEGERMRLLKHPGRAPDYRAGREHLDFVCRLKDVVPCRKALLSSLCDSLEEAGFELQEASLEEASEALARNTLCGTHLLDTEALLAQQEQQEEAAAAAAAAVSS
ncbi:hypothetical protein N2152v2_000359 [Parachlorella kessleri]